MYNWILQVLIKGFLNWLKSLWEAFIQKRKVREEGRQEIRDAVNKATERIKNEFEKIDNSRLTVDDALSRLRDRANSNAGTSGSNR